MKLTGAPVKEMSFNWRYLLDGLKPMKSELFMLGVSGDNRPAVIKNPEESSYFYLLMPVKSV
jgi:DNA polymerase III sliding clamp (beta) subunit (PCNA family)